MNMKEKSGRENLRGSEGFWLIEIKFDISVDIFSFHDFFHSKRTDGKEYTLNAGIALNRTNPSPCHASIQLWRENHRL